MLGVIVCVRSMYLAPLSDCSYTPQSPCPAGAGAPWHASAPIVIPREKRMRIMGFTPEHPGLVDVEVVPAHPLALVELPHLGEDRRFRCRRAAHPGVGAM